MKIYINLLIRQKAMGFSLHPVGYVDNRQQGVGWHVPEGNLLTAALCLFLSFAIVFGYSSFVDNPTPTGGTAAESIATSSQSAGEPASQPSGILARFQCRVDW